MEEIQETRAMKLATFAGLLGKKLLFAQCSVLADSIFE